MFGGGGGVVCVGVEGWAPCGGLGAGVVVFVNSA